ncbi:sigma-54-dependent Fis family transcriptional regulator [Neobacillus niacini]|uniref:sigma-54 interaction domain-containing protein n=1 Tax=Neobacillus niacini TaxID=86668 RepID=UPI0021CB82F6|nr:sigma 54-interacting transcriptional regulator [Neobacillus niacini]MCM3763820.1 sigma 54-interacting transcriptional regulator [Neobacillus niacini]
MLNLYKQVFDSTFDGLCIIDANGYGIAINKAACRICSFSESEFVGGNVKEAVKNGIISTSISQTVLKAKKPITQVVNIRGTDVLITGSPIKNEKNHITHVVLNIRDIGELNNLKIDQLLSIALKRKHHFSDSMKVHEEFQIDEEVIAKSPSFRRILSICAKIARVDTTVLIYGESGTGKEVVLNSIHRLSNRSNKPLIKVNCAAIPHNLLESELFGYEKGAFTGADSRGKPGLFEQADGGTIFLDEIGDMPLDLQVKLLRVLQDFEITRIGGRKSIKINVRVVSATNKNLERLVADGQFRQDLFYRLNIVPIHIPPLRERIEDIAPLAYHFLQKTNKKYGLTKRFADGTLHLFEEHKWPGNIREMENLIERLVVTIDHEEIQWADLPFVHPSEGTPLQRPLKKILQELEKKIIMEKLEEFKTTRKTAEVLGISQSALVKKLKRL